MELNKTDYKRLGDYIREVDVRNRDLKVTKLLGVSISKEFIPSIANTIGTDMSTYKIVTPNQFAYGPVTSRNGDKVSIALLSGNDMAIISQAYTVFEVIDDNRLLPEYLMMWFRRPEFDRYARFHSHGSAREIFDWDEMCDVILPIPPIKRQQEIVSEYETLSHRIELNNKMISRLEETAQTLYRKMFVDGIDKENLPDGWRMGTLGEISQYINEKIYLKEIDESLYISTENMLKDKKGITVSTNKPNNGKGIKFQINDILISNIRPYFKKIWKATFNGAASNDVLCIRSKNTFSPSILYYVLENDTFFEYVIAGSNGVKMPRGDKNWIMKYPLLIPSQQFTEIFNQKIIIIHKFIIKCKQENHILTELKFLITKKIK